MDYKMFFQKLQGEWRCNHTKCNSLFLNDV